LLNSPCIVPGGGTTAFQIPPFVGADKRSTCPEPSSAAATAVQIAQGLANVTAIASSNALWPTAYSAAGADTTPQGLPPTAILAST
jgi:hypothetical protein